MNKILAIYQKLPGLLKNKYFLTTMVFAVWMLFLDDYNMIFQYKRGKELHALNQKREFYMQEIEKAEKEKKELFSNADNLEKYARENYFMKRDNEDIFVIEVDSINK
jgi:cell division protein FtsB